MFSGQDDHGAQTQFNDLKDDRHMKTLGYCGMKYPEEIGSSFIPCCSEINSQTSKDIGSGYIRCDIGGDIREIREIGSVFLPSVPEDDIKDIREIGSVFFPCVPSTDIQENRPTGSISIPAVPLSSIQESGKIGSCFIPCGSEGNIQEQNTDGVDIGTDQELLITKGIQKYELVRDIGSGNFGVARLIRNRETRKLVAMKNIERGHKIDKHVAREIINHRSLQHPNIIMFEEVVLTPTHLAIVMEYAEGGELNERISARAFSEDEVRYFFQQLICGVSYCHAMEVCHRDLKLENILLDGSLVPRVKICDFGFSKSSSLDSKPKSSVGTPAYIAPEVLSRKAYDGKLADVWSCGVTLYAMAVGAFPFEDPDQRHDFRGQIRRVLAAQYKIPDNCLISEDCKQLIARIFVANPSRRITIEEIKNHPWFLKNLPMELTESAQAIYYQGDNPSSCLQSVDDIMKIVEMARTPPHAALPRGLFVWEWTEEDQEDNEDEEEEVEDED